MIGEVYTDDVGRCFCDCHRRVSCHECCLDFTEGNRFVEEDNGLRPKRTAVEDLVEQLFMLQDGIRHMQANWQEFHRPNMEFHQTELKRVNEELQALHTSGEASTSEVSAARQKFGAQYDAKHREMAAMSREWSKQNPGNTTWEFGGEETQQIYEKVTGRTSGAGAAAAGAGANPGAGAGAVAGSSGSEKPSPEEMAQDLASCSADCGFFTIDCDGCMKPIEHGAIGLAKLPLRCGRCRCTFYHDRNCQRAHYKEHKTVCKKQTQAREMAAQVSREPIAARDDSATSDGAVDECGICLQVMVSPITLQCSHSFCHGCLRAYQEHVGRDVAAAAARCALCRSDMPQDVLHELYASAAHLTQRATQRPSGSQEQLAELEMAMEKVDELLKLEPEHRACLFLKAELLSYGKKFEAAISLTQSFTGTKTTHGSKVISKYKEWWIRESQLLASCHMGLKDWQAAKLEIRKCVDWLVPADAIEFRNCMDWMTKCDYHLGEYQEAVVLSKGLFDSNRHYEGIYEPVADSYEAMGQLEMAVHTMEQAVAYEQPWNKEAGVVLKEKLKALRARRAEARGL
jgi:tetratricopeptide (TPR) repeat protein